MNRITALAALAGALIATAITPATAGAYEPRYDVETSSLHCGRTQSPDGTYRAEWCSLSDSTGDYSQVVVSDSTLDAWLHAEWNWDVAACQVWEDMAGYCWVEDINDLSLTIVDANGLGANGQLPDYNDALNLGLTGNFDWHIYMPNPADPNLQFPLIMFSFRD